MRGIYNEAKGEQERNYTLCSTDSEDLCIPIFCPLVWHNDTSNGYISEFLI